MLMTVVLWLLPLSCSPHSPACHIYRVCACFSYIYVCAYNAVHHQHRTASIISSCCSCCCRTAAQPGRALEKNTLSGRLQIVQNVQLAPRYRVDQKVGIVSSSILNRNGAYMSGHSQCYGWPHSAYSNTTNHGLHSGNILPNSSPNETSYPKGRGWLNNMQLHIHTRSLVDRLRTSALSAGLRQHCEPDR